MNTTDNGTQTTGTERTACTCKCGLPVKTSAARYIPGHDAKHVSRLVGEFEALVADDASANGRWHNPEAARDLHLELMRQLPTDALQVKFNRAIHNKLDRDFDRWATKERKLEGRKAGRGDDANPIWFGWHPDDYAATFKG